MPSETGNNAHFYDEYCWWNDTRHERSLILTESDCSDSQRSDPNLVWTQTHCCSVFCEHKTMWLQISAVTLKHKWREIIPSVLTSQWGAADWRTELLETCATYCGSDPCKDKHHHHHHHHETRTPQTIQRICDLQEKQKLTDMRVWTPSDVTRAAGENLTSDHLFTMKRKCVFWEHNNNLTDNTHWHTTHVQEIMTCVL